MLTTHAQTLAHKYFTDTLLHCQQVAGCMRYFAKKLNLTKSEQDYRYTVGLLHDVDRDVIGKNADLHLGDKLEETIGELFDNVSPRIGGEGLVVMSDDDEKVVGCEVTSGENLTPKIHAI